MAKLMRYEARSDLRLLLPVYAACLTLGVLSCLLRLLPDAGGDTLWQLAMAAVCTLLLGAAVTAQIAALAAGPAVSLIRFYRTLGTRGHFFFSLPLLPSQMLGAHLVLALAWTAAGALLVYNRFRPHDAEKLYVNQVAAARQAQAEEESEEE